MIAIEDLHALVDNELSLDDKARVEAAIQSDPRLKAEYEQIVQLKSLVAQRTTNETCIRTWSSCTARLNELDQRKKVETFVGKYAWAMCASIFLLIVGAGFYNRQSGGSMVATGDVAKVMSGLTPFSKPVNQAQDMASWIEDVSRGAQVQNADEIRVDRYAQGVDEFGRRAVAFALADRMGSMSLVIIKGAQSISGAEPMMSGSDYFAARIGDHNCIMWTHRGFGFTLIGDRSHEELAQTANSLRL